jgi:hypothetical protein
MCFSVSKTALHCTDVVIAGGPWQLALVGWSVWIPRGHGTRWMVVRKAVLAVTYATAGR